MSSDFQTHRSSRNLASVSSFGYRESIADRLASLQPHNATASSARIDGLTKNKARIRQLFVAKVVTALGVIMSPLGLRSECLLHPQT